MTSYTKEIYKFKNNKIQLNSTLSGKFLKLVPVRVTDENIKLICNWREKYSEGFLTKFCVTYDGTQKWLRNIWLDPERILFMIIYDGEKIGHIGIHRYDDKIKKADIDSVLRAVRIVNIRLMKNVLKIMFEWMFNDLKLEKIQLKVFSDNYKAINLYERVNMLTVHSEPLRKITKDEDWSWKITREKKNKIAERYLNTMEIKKSSVKLRT